MADIEKVDLESESLVDDRLNKLKELMPEVFTESGIDFDKLRLELGDEVDEGQERYAFTWPGKTDAIRQSQIVSTATLRPRVEKSRGRDGEDGSFDSDNIYIEGDNLEVLKLLQRGYHGKVKMIYIDPPYNTGHDFVYKDKFGDTIENYREQAGLTGQSNADTSGCYHSDWCSMMYPRLRLARELLSDDGAAFISIDDNEDANLREICNEIFGENNFYAQIVWQKRTSPDARINLGPGHDYILLYAKNKESLKSSLNKVALSEDRISQYKNPDNDPRGLWASVDITGQTGHATSSQYYEIVTPSGVKMRPPQGRCWALSKASFEALVADHRIWFGEDGSSRPRQKKFLSESEGGNVWTWWPNSEVGHNQEALKEVKSLFGESSPFDTPKPTRLIGRMLDLASKENSLIVDFFSGSATTAEAVARKNAEDGGTRSCILVQLPENLDDSLSKNEKGTERKIIQDAINLCDDIGKPHTICSIAEERIRRAGDKIKTELEESNRQLKLGAEPKQLPDIGFRVFTLDDSGIEKPEPGQLVLDVVKPDRSELDIVFEMMLKWGLELTLPVEKSEAAGYPVWSVACDELVCCMSRGLTIKALEAIADMEPRRVFILDSVLDDTLKLNAVQIFKHASDRMGVEIELRTV